MVNISYSIQSKAGSISRVNEEQGKELFESGLFETAIKRTVILHKDTVQKITIIKIIYVDRIIHKLLL